MTEPRNVLIFGASGGIGRALVEAYAGMATVERVHAVARRGNLAFSGAQAALAKIQQHRADITSEADIEALAAQVCAPDLVILATGLLTDPETGLAPEKSYRHQDMAAFEQVFRINTFGPALVAKHILGRMPREGRSVFAALAARVGSISDNQLGGWHAYRASKAALCMLMRNYAIEVARKNRDAICVCLHPGTVDTALSAPFQANVPDGKLFTAHYAAERLVSVLAGLGPADSGKQFDWAGAEVPA
ncbi:SDR family NAD(P)-dependent oxidoreductase [Epibacterium sp. MM17-32]|uniref:SDR family NAD(P)-dependent oxidoreductase n=1 Tax=Epibacterium sp. MM17-32 TaxID=2917734 RepID=UPI001EF3F617|nr:SDR family NAD(P)-dependent oxidoreductase [Epibacterium sp. MM17-32]MCG7629907.1 SDR family NAD(P)-dependent oxidoreductase [Epibacterium sp. MM17-32]